MKLKHISSFRELLVYLVASKNLTRQDAINASIKGCISSHPTLSGLPTLGALAYLILGIDGSDCVLKTLPLNFVRDTKLLSSFVANPLQWPVHVLDVVVYDYTTTE
jgi:hypothetical protein